VWAQTYAQGKDLVPPKVEGRRQGKLKHGFLNGFGTVAFYAVASGGLLPPDKSHLHSCFGCLDTRQCKVFKQMEARLRAFAPFQVTEAIGAWVGNTCSILSKDSHWETVEDLSALPKEQKPIWLPYRKANGC
jgi:hypothetical protein